MVHASDLNYYYCKYHGHVGAANRLFKEYVIASFLECWEFNRAPYSLIQVLPEHILPDLSIPRKSFDAPCFGLQEITGAVDLSRINEDILASSRPRIRLKQDLLKLAFFDIWTCNEDRNSGNYNILFKYVEREYVIYPIDHEACFNNGNFERGLVPVTFEDNLIYSTLFAKLFQGREWEKEEFLASLRERFYLCAQRCQENVEKFLQEIPRGWNLDLVKKGEELRRYLLNDEWFKTCWGSFLEFLEYFTK